MKYLLSITILLASLTISLPLLSQNKSNEDITYVRMEVKGMACAFCAYGMERKLKKIDGVENLKTDIKKGLIYFTTPSTKIPSRAILAKTIIDAGFTAGKIEFSMEPFDKEPKSE